MNNWISINEKPPKECKVPVFLKIKIKPNIEKCSCTTNIIWGFYNARDNSFIDKHKAIIENVIEWHYPEILDYE